jgi:acyl-CoA synthetase (AMP-forming)/AMP-acid ligase II/pimeloyl-ACP methyl ester carboxylesterase
LPPHGLDGLDPAWSRLVAVPDADGVVRTWHVLDNQIDDAQLTLLCVHGNPSWSYLFRNVLRQAPPGVRVLAVDQLDMGFSERTGEVRRLATRVDDLCRLTAEVGIAGPVVTVAHDWGGPISLGWALRHRVQLAGVVLMNTAVHQPAGSPAPRVIRLARWRPLLRNVTVRTPAFITGALAMSHPRPTKAVRAGFRAPYRSADRRDGIAEFVADIPLSAGHPSAEVLDSIAADLATIGDVPALLLWGAADPVFSDLYLHDLLHRLPGADVHRYPKAGHFVSEDVDAAGAIVEWITTLDGTGKPGCSATHGTVSSMIDTHGSGGARAAIVELGKHSRQIRFDQFAGRVERAARALVADGVAPGDRVGVMVPPGIELAVAIQACWRLGAVVVLIDSGLGPSGMHAAMRAARPDHLIGIRKARLAGRALRWPGRRIAVESLQRPTTAVLPSPPTADDTAAVVFTSGSTGPSKGVVYTHRQLEAQRDALTALYGITDDDRLVAAFAPFALFGPVMGITSVVPDMDVTAPATLTASALADAVVAIDATIVFASPSALANVARTADLLTRSQRDSMGGVRVLLSAGAPVRPAVLAAAAQLFPNAVAHTPYGMTECLPVADITLDEIIAATGGDGVCVGHPVEGVSVRIRPLDPLGRAVGPLVAEPGVVGEVVVAAPHARAGYDRLWRTERAASQPDGWHATGDVGQLDSLGRLWIGGRMEHVIATAEGVVTPVRFEQAIEAIEGVRAAAVVGVGPRGTQQVVAVVEPIERRRSPVPASPELTAAVRAATASPVAAVLVVGRLPFDRRHNSKIDRGAVARWATRALEGGSPGRL